MTPETEHLWAGDWRPGAAPDPPREPAATAARERATPAPAAARGRRRAVAVSAAAVVVALSAYGLGAARDHAPAGGAPSRTLPAATANVPATSVTKIYDQASPAVVSVRTGSGQGTGFLVDRDGTIVTNAHVVGDATTVTIRFGEDGARTTGRVTGADPSSDLAVVDVPASATKGVTPLRLADDATVDVGDQVVAIGNPFGLDRTATTGIVSAVGRSIEAPDGFSISGAIQTDAPINPGNSGGPLLDAAGRVIGVNSQIATSGAGGGNVGVGFAVPTSLVQRVVPALQDGRSVQRAYLGVSTVTTASGTGVEVADIVRGGPAAAAGLRAGDQVLRMDGAAVDSPEDVAAAIADRRPGDEVDVVVRRGGGDETLRVALGTRPTEAP
ncbi:MAG TPA: trypsin-like peptidase domain-containing protein [Baekduia sp.]|nr:trypsin-like peptidase domain-containing protein [Baekduia sp.]